MEQFTMRTFRISSLAGLVLLFTLQSALAQNAATDGRVRTQITITIPQDDAEVYVDGRAIEGDGTQRVFETAPLKPGASGKVTITTRWDPNTYTTMTRSRTVAYRAGDALAVDLTRDDPTDRVRVIYVPTPDDIAAEMVKLAGVTPRDVVFEPGCGDARITIAAVKAGARKGGLADRIEIRHGDALDIKDLSTASVVMLYMGDHFNLLIRPHLVRELRVGSRIVSHRFTMGDWQPDRTIHVTSNEGGEYELHLWTVTDEVKRRFSR
jgi:uncharacterized protein (TIGR03000 family)